ncbi:MAG TPA: hypothetical protein VHY91_06000 [Pirellulales bacterium]|jgi:hypothetical protein|nr:hypothetical protein [Pirellulales bacterium]
MRFALIAAVLALTTLPTGTSAGAASGKAGGVLLKTVVRVLTGIGAAECMRRAGNESVNHANASRDADIARHEYERVRKARVENVVRQFTSQGLQGTQNTIYSIFLNIDPNASSVYWADWFSKADVFFVAEIEGVGQFVLPNIRMGYAGGPVFDRIVLPELRPGTRVAVRVMDDDTTSDAIWRTVLQTRVNYRFDINGEALYATCGLKSSATASGAFALLDTPQRVVIDAPDQLATVLFSVPETAESAWVADGELRDSKNRPAGRVQFSQVWNTRLELAALESEFEQRVAVATKEAASGFGWLVFWTVLGLGLAFWFYKSFSTKAAPASPDGDASTSSGGS